MAGKLAEVLKAEKLVLLTNTPGVLDKKALSPTCRRARSTSCPPTARCRAACCPRSPALDAAKGGVNAVHIIDGRVPHALLLEILSDQSTAR